MTKYDLVKEHLNRHGKITNIEVMQIARTTSPQKVMQKLVHDGLVRSDKADNGNYHIYTLVNNQMSFI
jgi:predicted transcriptional regulator